MNNNQQPAQPDMLRDFALAGMQREAAAKGSTVSREQIEAAIAQDPEGNAARRYAEYVAIAQAAALTLKTLDAAGIDARKVEPEALMRAVEATRGVLEQHERSAPDLDHDDGPSFG